VAVVVATPRRSADHHSLRIILVIGQIVASHDQVEASIASVDAMSGGQDVAGSDQWSSTNVPASVQVWQEFWIGGDANDCRHPRKLVRIGDVAVDHFSASN